jgi:hypothetical protein
MLVSFPEFSGNVWPHTLTALKTLRHDPFDEARGLLRERVAMVFWKSRWELADMRTPDVLVQEFKAEHEGWAVARLSLRFNRLAGNPRA